MLHQITKVGARDMSIWSRALTARYYGNTSNCEFVRKAVITGGTDGIGAEICKEFLTCGMKVAVVSSNERKFFDLLDTEPFRSNENNIWLIPADLSDAASTLKAAEIAVEWAGGHVDVLVNHVPSSRENSVAKATVEDWDKQFASCVRAPFIFAEVVSGGMIDNRCGKIINISFQSSSLSHITSSALDEMMKKMGSELTQHNVQLNSVTLGNVSTCQDTKHITSMVSYLASGSSAIAGLNFGVESTKLQKNMNSPP
uniref:3-oxoacyl-[acyl-carrier-protein] reductase n=1 Tax=Fibrocapsa japonica TaxID=94617 RepID=A0A7S2XUV6_9STRA|mmetsp:Transcript_14085/g.20750  ORF Transcript_14085/g.20750 Transcript_14085/m.20750 type:complete len:256 (+) Transcript_14085:89-856(+)